jgi:sigma-B regulation protein RsbU (phosphoserine phosphatase)
LASDPNRNRPRKIIPLAAGLIFVVLVGRIADRLHAWTDRRFFREAYDAERILGDLSERVRTMVEAGPLLETVTRTISESLHVARVSVLQGPDIPAADRLRKGDVVRDRATLGPLGAELLLPLSIKDKLLGALSLGPKLSEEPYSPSDVRLLRSVAAQTSVALENSRLTEVIAADVARRERQNRELEIAREVQEQLFPQSYPPLPGVDMAGFCRPARGVGGDYYDFLPLSGGRVGIAIGDISGKGIPAALLMAGLQASLRSQAIAAPPDLTTLMSNLNRLICESSPANRYATFFYGEYDPKTRRLAYVNAGHNAPMLFRRGAGPQEALRLDQGGPVIGLLEVVAFQQGEVGLEPGDVLVGFTDGVSEAMNAADEEWGEERLADTVLACAGLAARAAIVRIMDAADAFVAGAPQHDDMTLIVVRLA